MPVLGLFVGSFLAKNFALEIATQIKPFLDIDFSVMRNITSLVLLFLPSVILVFISGKTTKLHILFGGLILASLSVVFGFDYVSGIFLEQVSSVENLDDILQRYGSVIILAGLLFAGVEILSGRLFVKKKK